MNPSFRRMALGALCALRLCAAAGFDTDVLPLFKAKCLACHGAASQRGTLDLRTPASTLKGGATGPAVVAGTPDRSLLMETK